MYSEAHHSGGVNSLYLSTFHFFFFASRGQQVSWGTGSAGADYAGPTWDSITSPYPQISMSGTILSLIFSIWYYCQSKVTNQLELVSGGRQQCFRSVQTVKNGTAVPFLPLHAHTAVGRERLRLPEAQFLLSFP